MDDGTGPDAGHDPAPAVEPRLHAGDVAFDADDAALLRAVAAAGSLNAAADALGRSYSRAHKRLVALEDAFGTLVRRERGGAAGGGSDLAPPGEALLARFDRLRAAVAGTARAPETVLRGEVVARDGELGVVETSAGRLRALVPDVDRIEVGLRADAVTLHAPGDAPAAGATSARNRVPGEVTSVDAGETVATVAVDVGAATPLRALVTVESVERLDLRPGRPVVASVKATATRAVPR